MIRFARSSTLTSGTAALLVLMACSNDAPIPAAPSTPATSVRAVIASTSFTDFPPDIYLAIPIPLTQGGVLDFTVNWTHPETYMIVSFGDRACTFTELNTHTCPFLITTQGSDKPRVIVTQNVAVGTYVLVLYSQPYSKKTGIGTDQLEAVSLQIGLTVFSGPTAKSTQTITVHPQLVKP
jgi:hypothetical protein